MLPVRQALALALVAALCAPLAWAQVAEVPEDPAPQTPQEVQCQPPVETCLPDLIASNPTADATDERFPVRVCADFVNLGDAPTPTPFRYLLSIDNVPTGEVQATKVYRRGEGDGVCWSDVTLGWGRHTMEVFVDSGEEVVESSETNNKRAINFWVAPSPKVDLSLSTFRVTPQEGGVGVNQIFAVNVTNVGTATSNTSLVSLEDTNGILANWSLPPLRPGQTWSAVHATRPEWRPVGTFVARATVDPHGNLSEIRKDNNEALLEYTVLEHPEPDFEIKNVTISGNRTEKRGIRVDVVVENVGDRLVRGNFVRLVNDTNATLAQQVTTSLLFPGGQSRVQFFLVLPAGTHNITAIADPRNEIYERNESNNAWTTTIEILPALFHVDRPNLVVERVYAMPEDPRPGERVSVGALIHNVGTNRSNATRVNFLVDDELVDSAPIPALPVDGYFSAYIPWTPPQAGSYTIVAVADQANGVAELDEMDNALGLDFLVTTQRAPEPPPPPPVPPPTTTPPTDPTTPTPTPTPPTPTTPAPPADTASRVVPGELIVSTSPAPGGATGVFSLSLRNPTIERVGLLTVQFKIDGKLHKEVLVQGIPGAGTVAATTGSMPIPAGTHKITAEIRVVGTGSAPPVVRESTYSVEAGETAGLPGFEAIGLVGAVAVAILLARRARR